MAAVFFLEKDLTADQVRNIEGRLKESPLVLEVKLIPSTEAVIRFKNKFPELEGIVNNLKANPFPASFEVTLHENILSSEDTTDFIYQMQKTPGIDDVQFNQDWVERMQSFSRLTQAVGFFLGGILILASFFIISNVIKLNVFSRKDEIEIQRFIGATNHFIRVPFLLEGTLLGFMGGALSLLLLLITINLLPLYLGTSLGVLKEFINFRYLSFSQSANVMLGGALIGLFGSLTSLARFLKK
jgi:cell division transport system permease protein